MLLLLTTSAFAQWQIAYKQDLSYTFYSVNFPSSTVGYIVGSGGVIYKTTDGGSSWVQQTSPTSTTLYKVFFTDDTHGFAVGDAGTIIHTTDGTNWTVHAQSGVITTKQLVTVWFVGSNGWIAGGAIGSGDFSRRGSSRRIQVAAILVIALQAMGLEITTIRDVTPVPHNGCRPPKRRRV